MTWMAALLALTTLASAEEDNPKWGGFGHATQGFMLGDVSGVGDELENIADGTAPGAALLLGGGGRMVLGGAVVLGGGGHGRFGIPTEGELASVASYGGGGQLDIGILLYNRQRSLLYPFAGVAMGGTDLVVANHADQIMAVGNQALQPGARTELSGGYMNVELGAGITRLFFGDDTQGGMILDLQMAVWIPASNMSLGAGLSGAPSGMLFRMNFGGGGFFY